jgi:hypothetical protein
VLSRPRTACNSLVVAFLFLGFVLQKTPLACGSFRAVHLSDSVRYIFLINVWSR